MLGHNTGRGGGGDRAEGGARPVMADVIGASGGNTIRKPTMAERSRLQQDMERQQKEEAARAAAADVDGEAAGRADRGMEEGPAWNNEV